jgi:hypothetical protein
VERDSTIRLLKETGMKTRLLCAVLGLLTGIAASAPRLDAGVQAAPPPAGLKAPGNCKATLVSIPMATWASVKWKDRSNNEDGFTVEWWRYIEPGGWGWVLAGTASMGPNQQGAAMGIAPGQNRYRVRAFNASATSEWSNWAQVTLP